MNSSYEQNLVNVNGIHVVFSSGKIAEQEEITCFSEAIDLVFCLNGSATWKIGQVTYKQSASELLFFSLGSCYKLIGTEEHTLVVRVKYPRGKILPILEKELFSCYSVDCDQLKSKLNVFGLSLVEAIFSKFKNNFDPSIAEHKFNYIQEEAAEILSAVSNFISNNYFCLQRVFPAADFKRKTKEVVSKIVHINSKDLDLEILSSKVNVSRSYLARIFKRDLGLTPSSYITAMKIDESISLIQNNNNELCNIAYDLGFSDQSHFNNIFKKYLLLTPGQSKKPLEKSFRERILYSFNKLFV